MKTLKRKFQKKKPKARKNITEPVEREREHTASGLPIRLATVEVASERMEEVSTPSRGTLVERLRHGIVSLCVCVCNCCVVLLLPVMLFYFVSGIEMKYGHNI